VKPTTSRKPHPAIPEDVHTVSVLPAVDIKSEDAWHRNDMLLIPLYDARPEPAGPDQRGCAVDNRRPDRPTFEALELFAAQASIMIESHQRARPPGSAAGGTGAREKTRLAGAEQAQSNLPVMLHKELEQSIALRGLNQRIERMRASLEIAALANRQESESGAAYPGQRNADPLCHAGGADRERTPAGIRLVEVIGSFPPAPTPEALFGQRNPLRQMLQKTAPRAAGAGSNLENAPEWQNSTLLNAAGSAQHDWHAAGYGRAPKWRACWWWASARCRPSWMKTGAYLPSWRTR
jgi:hypothetical protein